jgi:hypothetical protein
VYSFNPEIEDVFLLEMDILFGILEWRRRGIDQKGKGGEEDERGRDRSGEERPKNINKYM